ncbi:MAG TPA: ABC transporter ATP-binding protein [Candidatus Choladousia intestinipullorum]|nr:ABC transporter ATP-binding protein [Candidatus Choladousia intestinipullorum]
MKNIVFEHVVKAYGKNVIVKDLNMEIKEGERLILLGPSGCGKSTTLRMIAGLEELTEGNLYMDGRLVNHVACGNRDVSMVFQNYALFPHMTVRNNIIYGLKAHKMNPEEIEKRLSEVLGMLELKGLEERKPKDLSGGQRQRVALARAVVKRAGYFLLDEPLSNLDAQLRLRARKELVNIHSMYRPTMVYVTHDQIEAMTVGERIALMHEGKMEMLDTPSNVYSRPATVFCARFIGSPSMNIVEANYNSGVMSIGKQSVRLPEMWCRIADKNVSGRLYAGVRPEHVILLREKEEYAIEGTVRYVEDYGNRYGVYVHVEGDRNELIAIRDSDIPQPGEKIYIKVAFDKLHLFDRESEESLGYPDEIKKEREEYVYPD